ncbi:hypothetical protein Tco_0673639 [Tanacetum coccineum]
MHDDVQPNYVVDSHADYTSDSNIILYDQYVKDNAMPVNNVIDNSLTAELATYKEQVELYERRAKFELTEREQKIDEQLRIVITDRNIKEEILKKELHSVKMQLTSTVNHNKSMVEEFTSLKKDFKLKENKYLEEFLDTKALKEKNKVAIGYKNPLCLTRAKQVQHALYNGYEIIKTNHVPAIVHNSEDTLEIAEITRKKMNDKMNDPGRFEQIKECYLTEVIPFFKTLKEYFEGIQKALTKEIKEMKDIFEELEAEVDQNVVNRKHDEIERKNLLIANDNLIADCLSKEVFYVTTNSELNVSRFIEMQDAYTIVEARCLELEAELSNLHDKVQKDDHTKLVKRFSNLEVNHQNLQLKYQNLKESFGNNPSPPARDTLDFDSVFIIRKMKASIQGKDNTIKKLKMQISQLQETRSEADHSVKPRVLTPGRYAIDVEPIPPKIRNNREVHLDYLKHLKESVKTLREIVEGAKVERPLDRSLASACLYTKHSQELLEYVVQIFLWYLDSGCSKHMTGDRSRLKNFIEKFIGTVRFRNDHFGAIMGYGDYMIGDSVISSVYYMEGLGHNLFSIGQFCDSDLEVTFRKHSCYVRDTDGVELIKGSRGSNLYTISVEDMMKSSPICLLSKASKNKSWLWHRRLNHLNFVSGALCYPTNDSEDLGKLQPTADIGIFVGYAPSRKGTRSYFFDAWTNKFRARTKFGSCSTLCTPANKELEILFQPMFDEYMEPPRVERPVSPAPAVQVPVNSAGTPSSTTIDQDAPSPSHSPSSSALQSPSLHQGVAAESTLMEDTTFAPVVNNPFINIFAPKPSSEASSFGDLSSTESPYVSQTLHHLRK